MAYTTLYRKFRPTNFVEVKGQDPIVRTLSNQIKTDRVGHAYLFCGTRGTGKTSVAKIMARAINCENPVDGNPCNECAVCRNISAGTSLNVVEIDAASNNGVDSVRQIVEEVKYSPTEGKKRVYIIDEVHMLSTGAFNALLKTLEEPPEYVVFILATTEAHKIPITILSRCQRYDFKRISLETITDRLRELCVAEGIKAEDNALSYIAKCGDGSMRDSLSLMERCVAFYFNEELTYDKILDVLGSSDIEIFAKLLRFIHNGNVADCMKTIEEQVTEGRDLSRFVVDFTWYLRNLLLLGSGKHLGELLEVSSEQLKVLTQEASYFETEELMKYIHACCELTNRLRFATQKRVLIETEFIRLCKPEMEKTEEALLDRLRRIEADLENFKKTGVRVQAEVGTEEESAPVAAVNIAELPSAVAADSAEIVAKWGEVKKALPIDIFLTLSDAEMIFDKEGGLVITVPTQYEYDAINSEYYNKEIQQQYGNILGKKVNYRVVNKSDHPETEFKDNRDILEMLESLGGKGIKIITE